MVRPIPSLVDFVATHFSWFTQVRNPEKPAIIGKFKLLQGIKNNVRYLSYPSLGPIDNTSSKKIIKKFGQKIGFLGKGTELFGNLFPSRKN